MSAWASLLLFFLCACVTADPPWTEDAGSADLGCLGAACGLADGATPDRPARLCDARSYGARGDGRTKDTAALQAAINDCATTGGTVVLRDGTFLSGTIRLKSNLTLRITPTATLLGSQSAADYPDTNPPLQNSQLSNCKKALIYAEGVDQVWIEGGGTINGNARGVGSWNGNQIKEALRPMAIFTAGATHVTVQDLTVRDAATWAVVHMEVDYLTVRGLTVSTDLGATHDGIDVVDGHHVLIEDCVVQSGDDSICLKSGSQRGTRDVLVRRCRTLQSGVANGVKFGTASVGSFQDITVEDVVIENAQSAALAVESVDGARISNVLFRRVTASNVGTPFFVLLGSRDRDPSRVGSIDGLTFEDIKARGLRYAWGSLITGSIVGGKTFAISNIAFRRIDIAFKGAGAAPNPPPFTAASFPEYQGPVAGQAGKLYNQYPDAKFIAGYDGRENISYLAPGYGFFLRHANNVSFSECKASVSGPDPRPWRAGADVTGGSGTCSP